MADCVSDRAGGGALGAKDRCKIVGCVGIGTNAKRAWIFSRPRGTRVIETKSFNLEQPLNRMREIVHFTNVNDLHWAGIVDLPPWKQLPLNTNIYSDLYILQGELLDRINPSYTSGDFLSPGADKTFTAGPEGARLFAYQDRDALPCDHAMTSHQLDWRMGGTPDMKVASFIGVGHELMLVSWAQGTRMRFHHHPPPGGEYLCYRVSCKISAAAIRRAPGRGYIQGRGTRRIPRRTR